jgi:hypothetical protein
MWNDFWPIVLGAFLATAGGFLQAAISRRGDRKAALKEKREKAYLGYIAALSQLRIDHSNGAVKFNDYEKKHQHVMAELMLYASESAKEKIKTFQDRLCEVWEIGFNDGILDDADTLVGDLRNELGID